MKDVTVSIATIVKGGVCVSTEDAQKVYAEIYKHLKDGNRIRISFSGVSRLTTAFLNAAIGQIYGEFDPEYVRRHLAPPIDAENWHLVRLKMVVDRAKYFFGNKEKSLREMNEILGMKDEDI